MKRHYKIEVHPNLIEDESFCNIVKYILSRPYVEIEFITDVFKNKKLIIGNNDYQIVIGSKSKNNLYQQIEIENSMSCKSIHEIKIPEDFKFLSLYIESYMDYPIALVEYSKS